MPCINVQTKVIVLFTQTKTFRCERSKYPMDYVSSKHVRGYSFVCDCQKEKEMCFV